MGNDLVNNVKANVGGNPIDDAIDDPTEVAEALWLTEVTSVTPLKITLSQYKYIPGEFPLHSAWFVDSVGINIDD